MRIVRMSSLSIRFEQLWRCGECAHAECGVTIRAYHPAVAVCTGAYAHSSWAYAACVVGRVSHNTSLYMKRMLWRGMHARAVCVCEGGVCRARALFLAVLVQQSCTACTGEHQMLSYPGDGVLNGACRKRSL